MIHPDEVEKGKWILAGTFHFSPSDIDNLNLTDFHSWLNGAERINRSVNGNNV